MPEAITDTTAGGEPVNGPHTAAALREVWGTAPSLTTLSRQLVAVRKAASLFDKAHPTNKEREAARVLDDRAEALCELMGTMPAGTLGEAAAQVEIIATMAARLDVNVHMQNEVIRQAHCIERMVYSILPVLARAAGLNMSDMGWDWVADLHAHRFAGVGATPVSDPAAAGADAELLTACADALDVERERAQWCWASDELDPRTKEPGAAAALAKFEAICRRQDELLARIATTDATTLLGIRAKARVVTGWFGDTPPEDGSAGGAVLESLLYDLIVCGSNADQADAALIAACRAHPGNMAAYEASQEGDTEPPNGPIWAAYGHTRDLISNAEPQTMAGVLAKAAAAKAESVGLNGEESWQGTMGELWARDIVNDLLRLAGRA